MTIERTRDLPSKPKRPLWCGLSVASIVLISLVFGASYASASPVEEAADTVKSVTAVESVTETDTPPLPSAPSVPPPVSSPAPVRAPTSPQVPVDHVPVEVPTEKIPASSPASPPASTPQSRATQVSSSGAELPSLRGGTSSAKESAGKVASSSTGTATQRAASSVRNDASVGSDSSRGSPSVESRGPPSVDSAAAAPLARWFAYVWPAIALGRIDPVAAILATWGSAGRLPALTSLSVSDVARLLPQLMGFTESSDASTLSDQPGTPSGSPAPSDSFAPPSVPPPPSGGMSLFLTIVTLLLALVGLVALARLTVGEEFFSFSRWH